MEHKQQLTVTFVTIFIYVKMWTNAVLLCPSVKSMPTVRIMRDLMSVPVNPDLLEMAKPALVRVHTNIMEFALAFIGK